MSKLPKRNWIGIGVGVALIALALFGSSCSEGARLILGAVDPCADCYLELAPGQVRACLDECEAAQVDEEDPCAPCSELPRGKRAKCFEDCEGDAPPDSTAGGGK